MASANPSVRASRSAAERGGVVAARQPLPLNTYSHRMGEGQGSAICHLLFAAGAPSPLPSLRGSGEDIGSAVCVLSYRLICMLRIRRWWNRFIPAKWHDTGGGSAV